MPEQTVHSGDTFRAFEQQSPAAQEVQVEESSHSNDTLFLKKFHEALGRDPIVREESLHVVPIPTETKKLFRKRQSLLAKLDKNKSISAQGSRTAAYTTSAGIHLTSPPVQPLNESMSSASKKAKHPSGSCWMTLASPFVVGGPVFAANALISANSEFNMASLDGFVDLNKSFGMEFNSNITHDGMSSLHAVDMGVHPPGLPGSPIGVRMEVSSSEDTLVDGTRTVVSQKHLGRKSSVVYSRHAGAPQRISMSILSGENASSSGNNTLKPGYYRMSEDTEDSGNSLRNPFGSAVKQVAHVLEHEFPGSLGKGDIHLPDLRIELEKTESDTSPPGSSNLTEDSRWKMKDITWKQRVTSGFAIQCGTKDFHRKVRLQATHKFSKDTVLDSSTHWIIARCNGEGQDNDSGSDSVAHHNSHSSVSSKVSSVSLKLKTRIGHRSSISSKFVWNRNSSVDYALTLYPNGSPSKKISCQLSTRKPHGWKALFHLSL